MPHVDELVHDQHDPILVVSLASGDLAPTDRDFATAQSLISSCSDCARLHDDVLAIARATKELPPAQRTRDFRLTDADAAKLRPAGWRRLLGGLASGPLLSRQLGAGLATLGIAGLLLTALPGIQLGGFASSGAAASQPASAAEAPAYESLKSDNNAAAQVYGPASSPAAAFVGNDTSGGGAPASARAVLDGATASRAPGVAVVPRPASTAQPVINNPTVANNPTIAAAQPVTPVPAEQGSSNGPSTVAIISAVLLVAGLLLLLARRLTRGTTSA